MIKKYLADINLWFNNLPRTIANLVFAIVPLLLFIYMLFRLAEIHFFYQCWYDPVYAYLMNGLTFALGSNDVGHINHPGTPLQLFCALIIKLTGLIRGTGDLVSDVLLHPESYLLVIVLLLVTINCVMFWMFGLFAYRNLKSRNMAIAMQLIPLLSIEMVKYMPILSGESVIISVSIAIVACIILFDSKDEGHQSILFAIAILSGLLLATKISSLSILIVPFFFFKKVKQKSGYLLLSLLFFFLFITPVLNKMGLLFDFVKGMATHTGNYGLGEEKLIDWTIFFQSLQKLLFKELAFTIHFFMLIIGWIVIFKHNLKGSQKRLYLGITLATIFQTMLVARHYSIHYMMPVFALVMPLHGYFWIRFFNLKIGAVSTRNVSLIIVVLIISVFSRLVIKNQFEKGVIIPVEKTSQLIKNELKGSYIILTDDNVGTAFIEPALKFGFGYSSHSIRNLVSPILEAVYPDNYLWNCRDGFTRWTSNYLPTEVFSRNKEIYLYAKSESCENSMVKISDMVNQVGMSEFVRLEKIFQNDKSDEVIVRALIDTASIIQHTQPRLVIETGMEELTPSGENVKSNAEGYTFSGGRLRSNQFVRNGKWSMLFTPSNPYGLNISIPVLKGKRYKVEFWQRGSGKKQTLVVASANSGTFYLASNNGENQSEIWNKSQLAVTLPDDYPEESINFYLWNPQTDSVWIDDFSLKVFE